MIVKHQIYPQAIGQDHLLSGRVFHVSWLLARYCNLKCHYCWAHGRSDQKDHWQLEHLCEFVNQVWQQSQELGFNTWHWSWSGGEPTLQPGFLELLTHVSQRPWRAHMTTNATPGWKWWEKWLEATQTAETRGITASWHPTQIKNRERWARRLVCLQEQGVWVTINQVMDPSRWDSLVSDAFWFRDQGLNVTIKPQSTPDASRIIDDYTPQQLKFLQRQFQQQSSETQVRRLAVLLDDDTVFWMDQAERLNSWGWNQFQGWQCSAGYQSIIVRAPAGTVHRGYGCGEMPLGTIKKFTLNTGSTACSVARCVSSADSKIPKARSPEHLERLKQLTK